MSVTSFVVPAQAGAQQNAESWVPAFAGMTMVECRELGL